MINFSGTWNPSLAAMARADPQPEDGDAWRHEKKVMEVMEEASAPREAVQDARAVCTHIRKSHRCRWKEKTGQTTGPSRCLASRAGVQMGIEFLALLENVPEAMLHIMRQYLLVKPALGLHNVMQRHPVQCVAEPPQVGLVLRRAEVQALRYN